VLEHITTESGVAVVHAYPDRLGATITPQHLLYDRNAIFAGGINPHLYCLPILKRAKHRAALRAAATSGAANFFLGTDTAPHLRHLKEAACGCAGIFSAPVAIAAYLSVFAEEQRLDAFEAFASLNGPAFYRLPPNTTHVTYEARPAAVPPRVDVGDEGELVPLFAGETVGWQMVSP
jgi:dihydroorotase